LANSSIETRYGLSTLELNFSLFNFPTAKSFNKEEGFLEGSNNKKLVCPVFNRSMPMIVRL